MLGGGGSADGSGQAMKKKKGQGTLVSSPMPLSSAAIYMPGKSLVWPLLAA